MNIAIDGPAGAGKSTVAKLVAESLSYLYIDTGAMYRSLTYAALQENVTLEDGKALLNLLNKLEIELKNEKCVTTVLLNGEDITSDIRSSSITANVSIVAQHEIVRHEMVQRQRQLAKEGQVVLDGRDIGTHVLPNADLKIFLTASVEERAKRRYEELIAKGETIDYAQLVQEIAKRDELDSTREFAPLKKAESAIEVDTTSLTIDAVVKQILNLVKERASI
ncbi:(d)CMP kinase [Halalkalibacter sp. APA_J-10(15)]|uniref:(d)CMP kinase n=1 Tax=unclassified Halalkalibacter TaxID=2893063 RepID=UPI001FF506FC|nr:(d)CMP kinase [Halalkalibacter sp. APA_J-10(15)]MCK0472140.1 (d)CMP kinase [Halalkalibacter sp. APA_J-10(15)]